MLTYDGIIEDFGLPKRTIYRTLDKILPPLKHLCLKHLWELMVIRDINNEIVRGVIRLTTI